MQDNPFEWAYSLPTSTDEIQNNPIDNPYGSVKRHAACDECRKRKLRCSGEATGCSRCVKQSLACNYSVQKQMGRPPKKRAREDDDMGMGSTGDEMWTNIENNQFSSSNLPVEATAASSSSRLVPPVYSPFSMPHSSPENPSPDSSHNFSGHPDTGKSFNTVPATFTPWPDFSSVAAATPNPFTMPPGFSQCQSPPASSSSSECQDADCTCLSYVYLCLSHLSSLAPFPVSQHTLCSLFIAARTAQAVIRCRACPKKFQSGVQNVMFTGTLLNVIADAWLRISKADATELGKQAAPPFYVSTIQNSPNPGEAWKDWLRQTVRSGVIGGTSDEEGRVQCSNSPSLLSLIQEMETRQRSWHNSPPLSPDENPLMASVMNSPNPSDEDHWLCLKVAKSAREVISKFEFEPQEYPDGLVS